MIKKSKEEFEGCCHSIVQIEKSIKRILRAHSVEIRAIQSSGKCEPGFLEDYCIFCLIPCLKALIQLMQLSLKKRELFRRYSICSCYKNNDAHKNTNIERELRKIRNITDHLNLDNWYRNELHEALNTIAYQTKKQINAVESLFSTNTNKRDLF